ncbi:hypothetical protein BC834DRAFT_136927 [Gloeopeniophorella convolvens]|nr:hypothetical protein BC834DRAFT_136927 [Gloeopeniophorella convolvens]
MVEEPFNIERRFGAMLLAILINAYVYGIVTQQFISYWEHGYKDSRSLKLFVGLVFLINSVQNSTLWFLAWMCFVHTPSRPEYKMPSWPLYFVPMADSLVVFLANTFLCARIYRLTQSGMRLWIGAVLSVASLMAGVASTLAGWIVQPTSSRHDDAIGIGVFIWHGLQILTDSGIMLMLTHALLKSRSGISKSDSLVYHCIRCVVQTGCIATIWSIAETITWWTVTDTTTYTIFNFSAGTIYTYAIYDTLLSRTRLRERLNEPSNTNLEMAIEIKAPLNDTGDSKSSYGPESPPQIPVATNEVPVSDPPGIVLTSNHSTISVNTTGTASTEFACAPVGQPGVRYESSCSPHL